MRFSNSLSLVTDYDQTLVKARLNCGQRAANSFHALIHYKETPEHIRTQAMDMFQKYYPIEQDHKLSKDEKRPHMDEWWQRKFELFITGKFTQKCFQSAFEHSDMFFRFGIEEFLKSQVPKVVMSAGIADVIHASFGQFEREGTLDIIGNKFTFGQDGRTDGFLDMITNMNKQQSFYKNQRARETRDLVLMGDILEDANIADDQRHENVLRVGFYNDPVDGMC